MAAFDAAYTKAHPKTTVTVSHQGKGVEIKSEWTEAEIDAGYPRAEWLQRLRENSIDNVDDGLRRKTSFPKLTYPNASRATKNPAHPR